MAGFGAERAARDDRGLVGRDGVLVERRLGQVPSHLGETLETELVGATGAVPHTRLLHAIFPAANAPLARIPQTIAPLAKSARP